MQMPNGEVAIIVADVAPASPASRTSIRVGQIVVGINAQSLEGNGATAARAVSVLATSGFKKRSQSVALTVVPETFTLEYLPDPRGGGQNNRRTPGADSGRQSAVSVKSAVSTSSYLLPQTVRSGTVDNRHASDQPQAPNQSMQAHYGSPTKTNQHHLSGTSPHIQFATTGPQHPTHSSSVQAEQIGGAHHRERELLQKALASERGKRSQTEQDYDEIVSLLEAEVSHLRAQLLVRNRV
jgi:hypothetical protein